MGLYTKLYPAIVENVLEYTRDFYQIHGSMVRDMFIEFAHGRFSVDDHAEKLLKELVEDSLLIPLGREPTVSQKAFTGLYHSNKSYQNTPWGPGIIEHYWYGIPKPAKNIH